MTTTSTPQQTTPGGATPDGPSRSTTTQHTTLATPRDTESAAHPEKISPAVWAIAFACAISYMGIGLIDPILPTISQDLDASPGQTELLFSTYLAVTALVMFLSSWVSSRIGRRTTLLLGLGLIVVFALACASSPSVSWVIGFRGGWGVGNALFVSTALAAIIGSTSDSRRAVMLYEAAMGAGMALGPMAGGLLGGISWRGPFLGTAALMAIALVSIAMFLPTHEPRGPRTDLAAPFRALGHREFRLLLTATLFYNFAYFIMLAYAPFPVENAATLNGQVFTPMDLGLVFFGWGGLLALCSILIAPRLTRTLGLRQTIMAALVAITLTLVVLTLFPASLPIQVTATIVGGGLVGITNTAMTEAAMEATDLPRSIASSAYSGVRFIGGAMGPTLSGPISDAFGAQAPYVAAALAVLVTIGLMAADHLRVSRPREAAFAEADIVARAD
ncbi:MFS transporter [Actinomyces polynesiensis]|uniref:MFS transporter n=1 Tax=Actinomyces polynesiensis TaxID=1325934 RepID=UPI0009E1B4CD|nr:MFS transporter [Actinomyces polynesiensis]